MGARQRPNDPGSRNGRLFSQADPLNPVQEALAQLPFHIIINVAHDKQICAALDRFNVKYREEYYNFRQPRDFVYDPNDKRTFVYHLLGAVNCKDDSTGQVNKTFGSLVMTGADQVESLKQVVQTERKIPNSLLAELNDSKTYLFVGFNFDAWYLRLLLYSLGLSDNADAMPSWALHTGPNELNYSTSAFFSSRYKINFLKLPEADFVQDLCNRYKAELGAADEPAADAAGSGRQLNALIVSDPADEALRQDFLRALAPLRTRYNLHIHETLAGEDVQATFERQLADSQFIFPLISGNFFSNEQIIEQQFQKIIDADVPGKTIVSPVLIGKCMWKMVLKGPLVNAVVPNNSEPVSSWPDPAAAWTDVAQEIERRIKTHFS
ncbi:MAG: SIR2 family protein [Lewinellaceae bacterium]|nr:SIR2 family protein [Lewinellaceae bacterium]